MNLFWPHQAKADDRFDQNRHQLSLKTGFSGWTLYARRKKHNPMASLERGLLMCGLTWGILKRYIGEKHSWKFLLIIVFTAVAMMANGMEPAIARTDPTPGMAHRDADYGNIPLFFIPNQGQLDERVAYAIQGKDKSVYFTPGRVDLCSLGAGEGLTGQ
jgi:hypothetical protein